MGRSGPTGRCGYTRFRAQGVLEAAVAPDSDEAIAKEALHRLAVMALGPMKDQRDKAKAK